MASTSEKPKRVCASTARQKYHLSEAQLATLDCHYVRNPHYSSAPEMRLYLESDVEALSRRVAADAENWRATAEDRAAQKALDLKAARAEAKQRVDAFYGTMPAELEPPPAAVADHESDVRHRNDRLPGDLFQAIAIGLGGTADHWLRGPCAVACDLANLSLASRDFHRAAYEHGLPSLSADINPAQGPPTSALTELEWDVIVRDPCACRRFRLERLKAACKSMKCNISGTKPELVLRLLGDFGLTRPCRAPARLLYAMARERDSTFDALRGTPLHGIMLAFGRASIVARELVRRAGNVAMLRRALTCAYKSVDGLKQACVQAEAEAREREEVERRERLACHVPRCGKNVCLCGSPAAVKCRQHLCAHCCLERGERCLRHGTGC